MCKKIKLFILSVLFTGSFLVPDTIHASQMQQQVINPYTSSTGAQYSRYTGKRSRFCRLMRASRCKTLEGFERYLRNGCINDENRESRCLQVFCGTNCAGYQGQCPTPGSRLAEACQAHCRFVNLENTAAQNRLNACFPDAISAEQARRKAAGRTYDRAELRAARQQQRGSDREAKRLISELKRVTSRRDALFLSSRRPRSTTLRQFVTYVSDALGLTQTIQSLHQSLQNSGHSPEFMKQARGIVNQSDLIAQQFINEVGFLYGEVQKLQGALRGQGQIVPSAPMRPVSDGYVNVGGNGSPPKVPPRMRGPVPSAPPFSPTVPPMGVTTQRPDGSLVRGDGYVNDLPPPYSR